MPVEIQTVRTAVELAGNTPAAETGTVVQALYHAILNARIEGALQRHLKQVSEHRAPRTWEATTDSVEAALDALDPEPRNRRTAGLILSGNLFAQAEREPSDSIWPHSVRLATKLAGGYLEPDDAGTVDTSALAEAPEVPLTAERLQTVYSGAPMGPGLPQRNYIGAGYDPDGNVDLVFLAWVFGPVLAEGRDSLSTWDLRSALDGWIRLRHAEASEGRGPRTLVALVEQMRTLGREDSLREDSRVIAESAWLEVLTDDDDGQHTLADVIAFLDGSRFET